MLCPLNCFRGVLKEPPLPALLLASRFHSLLLLLPGSPASLLDWVEERVAQFLYLQPKAKMKLGVDVPRPSLGPSSKANWGYSFERIAQKLL